ncbi:hypothetical protein tloyanaT_26310 [Thalassotalea loyana]|uniref:Uncharacterized protein n=1 Tax=Thalassotalea loyana TaxID=280483 RepID=A0ABQ6HE50_9GAMM|nr:hypothetical protein [Thalassotalea loyana]GLX86378.1 hypothetical protein tloyanaT_26310 [Thalassotalea loyana]
MIIELPDIIPSKCGFNIRPASQVNINPYNQVEQVWDEPGDRWVATLEWRVIKHDEGRQIRAALNALRGSVNLLRVKDFAHKNSGTWSGSPRVNGNNQYGTTLYIRGMTANHTFGRLGDRFQLGERIHELTEDATADGTGKCWLKFTPEIINPKADGDILSLTNIAGLFFIEDPSDIPTFSGSARVFRNVSIRLKEALR